MKKFFKIKNNKPTARLLTALVLLLVCFISSIFSNYSPKLVLAESNSSAKTSINETDAITDLSQDENFDVIDYPANPNDTIHVIRFYEYAYSFYEQDNKNFALYVYVYNPTEEPISDNALNRINLSVELDANGKPTNYNKYGLKMIGDASAYNHRFYKFMITDNRINNLSIYDRLEKYERTYNVAGIEIAQDGKLNATDYNVATTFTYTGYSKGYAPIDQLNTSELKCYQKKLETVKLDVKHTFYRTQTSSKGEGYQNQIDTVYFSVPNRFFEEYGKLQRIKAEWYEYKTKDIIVTSNQRFYNKANQYLGIPHGGHDQTIQSSADGIYFNGSIGFGIGDNLSTNIFYPNSDWSWNLPFSSKEYCSTLYYLFQVSNIEEYDPYRDNTAVGGVAGSDLYNYILNYDKTYNNGTLPIKDGTISADLFASDIDDYRKIENEAGKIQNGYSYYDFDADVDLQSWLSWQDGDPSFWENWKNWGFWDTLFGDIPEETGRTVSPIVTLDDDDFSGSIFSICENLLINYSDYSDLKACYETAKEKEETVVLFRFATSDYYSSDVTIYDYTKGFTDNTDIFDKKIKGEAYRAWESVFLDFDIIQLTFNREGDMTVIPVVANPIDIVNDVTTPVQMEDSLWDKIKDLVMKICAWLLTITLVVIAILYIVGVGKALITIYNGTMHVALRILFTAIILGFTVLIAVYGIPFFKNIIVNVLGGL